MPYIPNDKKISEGDKINYVDHGGNTHKATMRELTNNHYAELEHAGQVFAGVPYSVTPDRHSWHHTDPEPEKEDVDGSTKGEQQRQGRTQEPQESAKAKEGTQGKGTQTGSKTSY